MRKMSELSGRLSADVSPVLQLAVPVASAATLLTTHVLSCACDGFGIGSGGPKRQPVAVQVRVLPVSACDAGPTVRQLLVQSVTLENDVPMSGTTVGSGTLTPPPPK